MKNVIVNTSALRNSGALSIYRQFIFHLSEYIDGNKYYIFVDSTVEQPPISGVTYISDDNHSFRHRIAWEHGGLNRWLKQRGIKPAVIVSLQNTGTVTKCKQVIYYHQSLPFYPRQWNPFKAKERLMWLYKHIYPLFVQSTISRKTHVVVQIPFIKRGFIKRFNIDPEQVHVLFPDVERIDVSIIQPLYKEDRNIHFLYPATAFPYKEHSTIVKAIALLNKHSPQIATRVRIHFTISASDYPKLWWMIERLELKDQFIMEGYMSHDKLLSLYKSVDALLFPSSIETLGLPLLEATAFGLPIIASNLDYAHEVLDEYQGVVYADCFNYKLWAKEIEHICLCPQKYESLPPKESSWKEFFKLINE